MDARTAHALIRFGLGRRPSEPPPADPMAWLTGQLDAPDPMAAIPGPSAAEGLEFLRLDRLDSSERGFDPIRRVGALFSAEQSALINNLLKTRMPFRERLVWFWTNHFTVSLKYGGEIQAVMGAYIREAIRPHVTGRFADMMLAVTRHPAMLMYLDNMGSAGPNSQLGKRFRRGLNENLARESLELHSVTQAGGYTQADVIEYAKILTGWTFEIGGGRSGALFREDFHEPGPKTVLGRAYPTGQQGGQALIAWLATHPLTFRNLATKLARHFVSDTPPEAAIRPIEAALIATGGDLKAATLALLATPDAWKPLTKIRAPMDYVFAVLRGLDMTEAPMTELHTVLPTLGQPMLGAPLPNGFDDTAASWTSGEALMRRVDWVYRLAPHFGRMQPETLARDLLGDLLGTATLGQVRAAGSQRDGLTLLLTSPEFQRR